MVSVIWRSWNGGEPPAVDVWIFHCDGHFQWLIPRQEVTVVKKLGDIAGTWDEPGMLLPHGMSRSLEPGLEFVQGMA